MGDLPGHQQEPCVAFGQKGGFMVWHNEPGQADSSGWLVVQSLNQSMVGVGLPVPLSQSPVGTREGRPCIALLTNGGAAVAWETGSLSNRNVQVRFLAPSGIFASAAITVNKKTVGDQFQPAVTVLKGGGVVVSWTSTGQDNSGNGIYAQRFTAEGAKIGGEFRINESIKWNQTEPALASLADGRFVSVWVSEMVNGQTAQGAPNLRGNLMGRLFKSNGQPVAGEYRLNHIAGVCSGPVVSPFGEGFVVAWEQQDEDVMSNQKDIFVRTFDKDGLPPGPEARWNALVAGLQTKPDLAVYEGDGLLVWECEVKATNSREVHARMLSGGAEFRVNKSVLYHQQQPTVAVDGLGNYMVSWVDFIKPRNSILAAIQFNTSDRADVTAGAHVTYNGPGASLLVLGAKTVVSKDPVASEIQRRGLKQQLTVEFGADEQSRLAALVAQAAAATKASGLLEQMAVEAKESAALISGGEVSKGMAVRHSPMTEGTINPQGTTGAVFPNTPSAPSSVQVAKVGSGEKRGLAAGMAYLSLAAQGSSSKSRAYTAQSTVRRRSALPVGGSSLYSGSPYRQTTLILPRGMQRLEGYVQPKSARGVTSGFGDSNRRSISRKSPLPQAQGTAMARRISPSGLATLRSQTVGGSRSIATATSRLNGMRGHRMSTQVQQSRASSHVNASLVNGGTGYKLQWASRAGSRYQVQRSRDSNSWVNDGPVKRGTGQSINSSVSTSGQYRYFRVIRSQ